MRGIADGIPSCDGKQTGSGVRNNNTHKQGVLQQLLESAAVSTCDSDCFETLAAKQPGSTRTEARASRVVIGVDVHLEQECQVLSEIYISRRQLRVYSFSRGCPVRLATAGTAAGCCA